MEDRINVYRQGEVIPLTFSEFYYKGVLQTAIVDVFTFYFEIVKEDTRTSALTVSDANMSIADNGGTPTVVFDVATATLDEETLYECELAMVHDASSDKVSLDTFFLRLRKPVATYP